MSARRIGLAAAEIGLTPMAVKSFFNGGEPRPPPGGSSRAELWKKDKGDEKPGGEAEAAVLALDYAIAGEG